MKENYCALNFKELFKGYASMEVHLKQNNFIGLKNCFIKYNMFLSLQKYTGIQTVSLNIHEDASMK